MSSQPYTMKSSVASVSAPLETYHQHIQELAEQLATAGSLGVIVFDMSSLVDIEYEYGVDAFREVRQRVIDVLRELPGKAHRQQDVLALDEPGGVRIVLFMQQKRKGGQRLAASDVATLRDRLFSSLPPKMAHAAFPYQETLLIELGHGLALHNPLLGTHRVLARALQEALARAAHQRRTDYLRMQERIQAIISREKVLTSYQPIMRLEDRDLLGFEALSRGAKGTGLETPDVLFHTAREHNLLVELDRLCRRRALERAGRLPKRAKVFVNSHPSVIHDPEFRAKQLVNFLEHAQLAPDRIVIEITEKLVIENYSLFGAAMADFTDLGIRLAVDDLGAGYSGLESVARLRPSYLKINAGLVRDLHVSQANQEMIKAIVSIGRGIGATVIAEGIETQEEATTLRTLFVEYGQGFLLSRPLLSPD